MWTDARTATAWAFAWLILLTIGFLLPRRPAPGTPPHPWLGRMTLPIILLIAAIARLVPALWLPVGAGYDIESFRLVTDALLSGNEVYTSVLGRHPYLPLQMYVMGGMAWLSNATGLPYVAAIKLPAVAADVALTWLIYRSLTGMGRRPATAATFALLYALNPVSVLVTSYHGQFEAVTLLLMVTSWSFWRFGRRGHASAVALGFAILNKTWPVIMLPVMWLRLRDTRSRLLYALLALGIPLAGIALYLLVFQADPMPMLRRALTHRGVPGYWGVGSVLAPLGESVPMAQSLFDGLSAARNVILVAGIGLALWWTRRQSTLDALLTVILTLLAVTVGFGIQWLVWPIPFALLALEERWVRWYSLAGAFMLAVHLYGLHMFPWLGEWLDPDPLGWLIRLSALPVWLITVWWTVDRYRRARAEDLALATAREQGVS
jgi:hypothetical protein